jgi:hypothetical protein
MPNLFSVGRQAVVSLPLFLILLVRARLEVAIAATPLVVQIGSAGAVEWALTGWTGGSRQQSSLLIQQRVLTKYHSSLGCRREPSYLRAASLPGSNDYSSS